MLHYHLKPLPSPDLDEIRKTIRTPGWLKIIGALEAEEAELVVKSGVSTVEEEPVTAESHADAARLLRKAIDRLNRISEDQSNLGSLEINVHTSNIK
jgi:hypothetical protein